MSEAHSGDGEIPHLVHILYSCISCLIIYVCSQLPLYGTYSTTADPLYWMRGVLISNRGTLMELGIIPIYISGWVMQLLVRLKIPMVANNVQKDPYFFNAARNLLGVVITVAAAVAYVVSGMYGNVAQIGLWNALEIIYQLCAGSAIVMGLDEAFTKGYGLFSGICWFVVINISIDDVVRDPFFHRFCCLLFLVVTAPESRNGIQRYVNGVAEQLEEQETMTSGHQKVNLQYKELDHDIP